MSYQAAVITVSDRASAGVYEDKSGPAVAAMLKEAGYEVVYTSRTNRRRSAKSSSPAWMKSTATLSSRAAARAYLPVT
jgi:molybdopterin biosynthesis enzyme MoaB